MQWNFSEISINYVMKTIYRQTQKKKMFFRETCYMQWNFLEKHATCNGAFQRNILHAMELSREKHATCYGTFQRNILHAMELSREACYMYLRWNFAGKYAICVGTLQGRMQHAIELCREVCNMHWNFAEKCAACSGTFQKNVLLPMERFIKAFYLRWWNFAGKYAACGGSLQGHTLLAKEHCWEVCCREVYYLQWNFAGKYAACNGWMDDGWVRVLRPFNSISVISRRWKGEHERLCAMKCRLGSGRISPPAGFEPATPWSEVGSANRSATRTLLLAMALQGSLLQGSILLAMELCREVYC